MNARKIYILIFIVSVCGLVFVQYQYLRVGLNLARVQFGEKMGMVVTEIKEGLEFENELTFLVGKAITGEEGYFRLSLDSVQDASRYFLDDYLKSSLVTNGINADYVYVLRSRDSLTYLSSPESFEEGGEQFLSYPVRLEGYLPERAGERLVLELKFKDLNRYFVSQLNGLIIPGIVFLIGILGVTIWVFRAFYLQRNVITITNEFINNLTHELKTPVFSIGVATRLLEEKGNDQTRQIVQVIRGQVDKLNNQINRVLDLATVESQGILKKDPVELTSLLSRISDEYAGVSEIEDFDFSADLPEEKLYVKGAEGHLENVIGTLLDNARKYSSPPRRVELGANRENGMVRIFVRDNGIGIPEKEQSRIFEKFYRVSSGDLHDVKGHGLGLNYVQTIVRGLGGKVIVISKPGMGSEFIIELPLIKRYAKEPHYSG
ncbi:sensor histidine kinase [Robertkochia aurantiaca]|uniref:sensor histidine kinase n=1 Tax=Robertkochia aurantiaca TaxID=2873700 RepID=UPI001CCF206F|nr:HAMP domain-containing sensor histidine kinase [Robertkochia sp. 3YJGBD-33]